MVLEVSREEARSYRRRGSGQVPFLLAEPHDEKG